MNANALLQFLSGKKTYLTIAAIFVILFGVWQAWWKVPSEVYVALMALALAFLRNGISNGPPPAPAADHQPQPKALSGPSGVSPVVLMIVGAWLRPFMAMLMLTAVLSGCAHLQPGADPLVVNVERTEAVGQSTFSLILNVDNTDRGFWQTNAPAFHGFCQWLRQPQTIEQTNTLPRAAALLLSLDDVKNQYKTALVSSNALLEALGTFSAVLDQAVAWSTIITNHPSL